ncbi:MAG TPA: hypothetical protein PLJ84_01855 [Bacteroidales bacterium]|nr:hypothetical protein [Bacteroidales bacterium]HPT01312.1 hypothetical protein [Bacteroidales bacterium]
MKGKHTRIRFSRWWGVLFVLLSVNVPVAGQERTPVIIGHIRTEKNSVTDISVILRELPFREGDTIGADEFDKFVGKSVENLLNTSLFNFVTADTSFVRSEEYRVATLTYKFVERWYVWPAPILEISDRNINAWYQKRDYTRFNYGAHLVWNNVTGRMENLDLMLRFGKNQHCSLLYDIPYIDRHKQIGVGLEAGLIREHEVGYITEDDKLLYAFNKKSMMTGWYTALHILYRHSIYFNHELDIGYQRYSYSDTLLDLNPGYLATGEKHCWYPSVYYKFKADFRDAKYYPLTGWYFDAEIFQAGFDAGDDQSVTSGWIKFTGRIYRKLANRWYAGAGMVTRISTFPDNSYFMNTALGYNRDFVRGYEYYVIDGTHFGVFKSSVKFALIPERAMQIGIIPTEKFSLVHYAAYLTWFGDAGYVCKNGPAGQNNQLPGTLLLGSGLGLDLVTYYDKVMRIEFTLNRKGEKGIYLHFIAGL